MNTKPFTQAGQIIELRYEYLSVRGIWLYVRGISRTRLQSESKLYSVLNVKELHARSWRDILKFKWQQLDLNPEPFGSWMNTQPFGQTGQIIELCSEYLSVRRIWQYPFFMSLTRFQSESALCCCMNGKELRAWSRPKISNLNDCNWTRTWNHLVCKWTVNHLAKLVECLFTNQIVLGLRPVAVTENQLSSTYKIYNWLHFNCYNSLLNQFQRP